MDSSGFLPHSICLALDPLLLGIHAVSDVVTALAYYSVPLALVIYAVKRKGLKYRFVLFLFAAFVLACGTTHLMGLVTLWTPAYWLQGVVKAATALVSLLTAVVLWPLIPKALALPSPAELEREVAERKAAEACALEANRDLEERVRARTAELERINASLESEIETRNLVEKALMDANTKALRAKEAADKANLAKSKFLAAASHDLRQPFQALRLFLDVLRLKVADDGARPVVDKAVQALEAGESLLRALLDISTLQAGTLKPKPQRFPLSETFAQIETEWAPLAASQGVGFRVVGSSAEVFSDPVLLQRLVRNLVANALRYTPSGKVLVGCRREGASGLRIEVWDTGIGIPEQARAEIFEEFTQLGNPERDRSKGLGLGLAIVQRLAELLGMWVSLSSEPGRGSVFRVHIRAADPSDSVTQAA